MSFHVEIPEPLAEQVNQAARSQAKSPSDFVLEAVQSTLTNAALAEPAANGDAGEDPLLGLLADAPELADFIENSAMHLRENRPLRSAHD